MLNGWDWSSSDWPSGTSEGVASWGPFTHQHYLKTTHINKDLLLCQTPLHILPAFNWNGNTLPRPPPPKKKKNYRQAACTFCSCVRGNNAPFMKGSGTCLKRGSFPGLMLIVDRSCLALPEEKKTLLRVSHLKSCHCFIRTSVSLLVLWFDKQPWCHPILIQHPGSASKQFIQDHPFLIHIHSTC